MPTISRKRRGPVLADSDDEADDSPAPAQSRRRSNSPGSAASENGEEEGGGGARDGAGAELDTPATTFDSGTRQQMVKDLVRLALASEYSRTPIRRADIFAKVLGRQGRQFRSVFDEAQTALRQTFGMELVELPAKEKITLKERRAAQSQKTQGASGGASQLGTNAWILRNLLPAKFRIPDILTPPKVPTEELEAAYVGLYSFVVAVIMLNGGVLPEAKLERYLRRTNAEVNTPVDRTEKLLQRMIKDGYLVRSKENVSGDEVVEYMVGTRGKMEVGERGVENMVRNVYGPEEGEDGELDKRIERSLKVGAARTQVQDEGQQRRPIPPRRRGRPRNGGEEDDDGSYEN